MRHRPVRLPGPEAGRHHRDLRGAGDPPLLTHREPRLHVAVVRFELHIPHSRSLKEKRAALKPVVEGIRQRFSLSVAEVGYQEKWQRAMIGVAVVSGSHAHAGEVVDTLERWIWSRPEVEVSGFGCHWSTWDFEE